MRLHPVAKIYRLFWTDLCWKSRLALVLILTSFVIGQIFGAQP